jgi:hypothetical protein
MGWDPRPCILDTYQLQYRDSWGAEVLCVNDAHEHVCLTKGRVLFIQERDRPIQPVGDFAARPNREVS